MAEHTTMTRAQARSLAPTVFQGRVRKWTRRWTKTASNLEVLKWIQDSEKVPDASPESVAARYSKFHPVRIPSRPKSQVRFVAPEKVTGTSSSEPRRRSSRLSGVEEAEASKDQKNSNDDGDDDLPPLVEASGDQQHNFEEPLGQSEDGTADVTQKHDTKGEQGGGEHAAGAPSEEVQAMDVQTEGGEDDKVLQQPPEQGLEDVAMSEAQAATAEAEHPGLQEEQPQAEAEHPGLQEEEPQAEAEHPGLQEEEPQAEAPMPLENAPDAAHTESGEVEAGRDGDKDRLPEAVGEPDPDRMAQVALAAEGGAGGDAGGDAERDVETTAK